MTTVDSVARALEQLALGLLRDVNMIITYYWMPGMTGYELLKHVKESSKLKEIPDYWLMECDSGNFKYRVRAPQARQVCIFLISHTVYCDMLIEVC